VSQFGERPISVCSCWHWEFMHLNDARNTVATLFVLISFIGQPHLGQFIEKIPPTFRSQSIARSVRQARRLARVTLRHYLGGRIMA
jgi:hypothetical protein